MNKDINTTRPLTAAARESLLLLIALYQRLQEKTAKPGEQTEQTTEIPNE